MMSANKVCLILAVCVLGTTSTKTVKSDRLTFMEKNCHIPKLEEAELYESYVTTDDLMVAFAKSGLVELIGSLDTNLDNIQNLGADDLNELYIKVVCTMGAMDVIGEKIFAGGDAHLCADSSEYSPDDPLEMAKCTISICQHILDVVANMEANTGDAKVVADDFIRITLSLDRLMNAIGRLGDFSSEVEDEGRRTSALDLLRSLLESALGRQKRSELGRQKRVYDMTELMIDNCPGGDTINAELHDTTPDDPAQRLKIVIDSGLKAEVETLKATLEEYVSADDGAWPDVVPTGDRMLCLLVPFYAFQNHAYAGGEDACIKDDAAAVFECLKTNFQNMVAETEGMEQMAGGNLEDMAVKAYNVWEHVSNLERGINFFLSLGAQDRGLEGDRLIRLLQELLE